MLLYLIRHAESAPPDGTATEAPDEWHVTDEGRGAAARVASVAAHEFAFGPGLILASRCAAAQETVEPIREALGGATKVATESALDADASLTEVYRALAERRPYGSVAIITHVPPIARLLPDLLGAEPAIEIPQGGIACIQCRGEIQPGKGKLIWLLPPRCWFDGESSNGEETS